eukprot:TRINITY_DN17601_c0_g1_i1.p1 TRINITY_DN17601_c0_g1~~TRINITY_DN17601_c0_g1_i1.p1  ORF type:complete len:175 (+),score=24.07 TRINITY_DN17601_c0_g1_i1:35-526(+)
MDDSHKINEILQQNPLWSKDDVAVALHVAKGNQAKALLSLMKEEKVQAGQKKPKTAGTSSFGGLLNCLNERDHNSRGPAHPTIPDMFTQTPTQEPSNTRKRKRGVPTVTVTDTTVKRLKVMPDWPEPGYPNTYTRAIQYEKTKTGCANCDCHRHYCQAAQSDA